jgi:F5/8 type C domain
MESNHFFPGLETGLLNISCSSVYALTHAVERCLINYKPREGSTGWGAAYNNLDQYIQFSSPIAYNFHKICTKGQGNWDCWVRSFVISYTLDGTLWINYNNSQILDANTDRNTIKVNDLVPFQARVVRIKPYTWYGHICMRVEMYISHNTSDSTDLRLNFNNYSLIPAIEIGMVVRASSIYDASHDLSRIRLNFSGSREGAMSWQAGFNNLNQWVLVSTLVPKKWYKVSTQGGNNREQ